MTELNNKTLRRALQELPRSEAEAGFTRQVLARLPEPAPARRPSPRFYWGLLAVTVATALVAAVAVPSFMHPVPPAAPAERTSQDEIVASAVDGGRLQRLLAERQEIVRELQRFRSETEPGRPVLYLGGDESVDLVVDLAEVARRRPVGAMQPAVRQSSSRHEIF